MNNRNITQNIKSLYNNDAKSDYNPVNAGGKIYGEDVEFLPSSLRKSAYGCAHIVKFINLNHKKFLDLGCGQGVDSYLLNLKTRGHANIVGMDLAYEMLIKAKKNVNKLEPVCANGDALPFKDNEFESIISNAVIHLSPNKSKLFKELFRVLTPQGEIVSGDIMLERGNRVSPIIYDEFIKSDGLFLYGGIIPENEYFNYCFLAGFDKIEILEKHNIGDLKKAVDIFSKKNKISSRKRKKLELWVKQTQMNIVVYKITKNIGLTQNIVCPGCGNIIEFNIIEEIEYDYVSCRVIEKLFKKKINYFKCSHCNFENELTIPFVLRTRNCVYHIFPKAYEVEKRILNDKMNMMINSVQKINISKQELIFGFDRMLGIINKL